MINIGVIYLSLSLRGFILENPVLGTSGISTIMLHQGVEGEWRLKMIADLPLTPCI